MGLINAIAGISGLMRGAGDLTAVVRGDKGAEAQAQHQEYMAALSQLGAEFAGQNSSWFDILINGLNRLPRPALAMGTIGLFVYAMADPIGFADRMQGLQLVPTQLWWLLGAIVSFYFGARELHYFRDQRPKVGIDQLISVTKDKKSIEDLRSTPNVGGKAPIERNAAVENWRNGGNP